ncbi:MAG: DDE-type integrase/transposase/recombinase [Opitutales bacterium]
MNENQALIKVEAISCVKELMHSQSISLTQALCEAANREWGGRLYNWATLEKWYYTYRNRGFEGLQAKERKDKGSSRSLTIEQKELLVEYRKNHPNLTVRTLIRHLRKEYPDYNWCKKESSIHRYLHKQHLSKIHLKSQILSPVSKKFETDTPNELWMTDAMHGPSIKSEGERAYRTYLLAFIDDHSRVITGAGFYKAENTESLMDVLYDALTCRGIPQKIYTDQGKVFTCQHLKQVCANLQIRLIHAQPYAPQSKGKIERFFRTVRSDFLQGLQLQNVNSLQDLNRTFHMWLEDQYHSRPHNSLLPETPIERFQKQSQGIRWIKDNQSLKELFLCRKKRKVQRDGTLRIQTKIWEVSSALRGQFVEIRFNPFDLNNIDVYFQGTFHSKATPCNPSINAYKRKKKDQE